MPDLSVIVHDSCCMHIRRLVNRGGVRHPAPAIGVSMCRHRAFPEVVLVLRVRHDQAGQQHRRCGGRTQTKPTSQLHDGASRPEANRDRQGRPWSIDTSTCLVACGRPLTCTRCTSPSACGCEFRAPSGGGGTVSVLPRGLHAMITGRAVIGSPAAAPIHRCLLERRRSNSIQLYRSPRCSSHCKRRSTSSFGSALISRSMISAIL